MKFERTVLDNGIRLLSHTTPDCFGARFRVTFQAGACQEEEDQAGLAHLVEHMPFKGSLSRDARAIALAVERTGGEIDAFTDHYETSYLGVAPALALPEVFGVAADMLCRPRLDPDDLARERAVILEELRTYEDEAAAVAYARALAGLWKGWPQGRPVAGTRQTVARHGVDAVKAWLDRHYGANRLVIATAGAVEHAQLVEMARRDFGDLPVVAAASAPLAVADAGGPRAYLQRREAEQVAVCLAMPALAETDPNLPAAEALAMILGGNDCSRLFTRLRDDLGLVYGVDASLEAGPTTGQLVISTECAPGSLVTVLREIERVLDDLIARPPTEDEVSGALMVMRARWLLPFDTPTSYVDWLVSRELWHGQVQSPREVVARFEGVTPAAVHELARRWLVPTTRHLALVGALAKTWRPNGWTAETVRRVG